jgi:GNAT superfamily N-acetyltransferase
VTVRVIDVTDDTGNVVAPEWLAAAETVHRQLRDAMRDQYVPYMRGVLADGARMSVAVRGDAVVGVALYRVYRTTYIGRQLYVDDLVTDAASRSQGVGHALLSHLETKARALRCRYLTLDSATHRHDAHRFYLRERMSIASFHFVKPIAD